MKFLLLVCAIFIQSLALASPHEGIWQGSVEYKGQSYPLSIEIKEAKVPNPSYPNTFSFYQVSNSSGSSYMGVEELKSKVKISIPHNQGILPYSSDTHKLHSYRLYGNLEGKDVLSGHVIAAGWTSEVREGSFHLEKISETQATTKEGRLYFNYHKTDLTFANYMAIAVFSNGKSMLVHQEINRGFRSEIKLTGRTVQNQFNLKGSLAFYRRGVYSGTVLIAGDIESAETEGLIYKYLSGKQGRGRDIGKYWIEWN